MYTQKLLLSNFEAVKKFVHLANQYDFAISLFSGKYKVDAKSIMGIFSLDLTKPIQMQIEQDTKLPEDFEEKLQEFKQH